MKALFSKTLISVVPKTKKKAATPLNRGQGEKNKLKKERYAHND